MILCDPNLFSLYICEITHDPNDLLTSEHECRIEAKVDSLFLNQYCLDNIQHV